MNLLARYPKRVPSDLQALVTETAGATVEEIRRDYGEVHDSFLVLAELFGILDYQTSIRTKLIDDEIAGHSKQIARSTGKAKLGSLEAVQALQGPGPCGPGTFGASLELCLQQTLKETQPLVGPESWFERCDLFWGAAEDEGENEQKKTLRRLRRGNRTVKGALRLPGGRGASEKPVLLRLSTAANPFEVISCYAFAAAPEIELCVGKLVVKKERGRPGATRIIHEKRVRYVPGSTLEDVAQQTVTYWVEAETLCLFLPG